MKFNPDDIDKSLEDLYIKVTDSEIKLQGSQYVLRSYEDGIKSVIDWIQGNSDNETDPMD